MLGRSELLDLFGELDGLLAGGVTHELLVVGGAALAGLDGAAGLDAQLGAPELPGLDI